MLSLSSFSCWGAPRWCCPEVIGNVCAGRRFLCGGGVSSIERVSLSIEVRPFFLLPLNILFWILKVHNLLATIFTLGALKLVIITSWKTVQFSNWLLFWREVNLEWESQTRTGYWKLQPMRQKWQRLRAVGPSWTWSSNDANKHFLRILTFWKNPWTPVRRYGLSLLFCFVFSLWRWSSHFHSLDRGSLFVKQIC